MRNDALLRPVLGKSGWLILDRSVSGWSTEVLMEKYLRWLRYFMEERRGLDPTKGMVLLWDQYGAHCTARINAVARELRILLVFIPAGQTDMYQPLDRRIFGILKSMASRAWRYEHLNAARQARMTDMQKAWAIRCLVDRWRALKPEHILAGWDFYLPRNRQQT
jgi:hypothetical protein